MRLIVIRHGETIENTKGIATGHLPGKLSKRGIEQNKKLAKLLKNEKIDCIYSSDLARAADTAKEIAKYHPSTPIFYSNELRERSFGKAEGKPIDFNDRSYLKLDFCESNQSIINRAKDVISAINFNNTDKSVLIVGHGGIIAALMANLLKKPFDEILEMGHINNASITIFDPVPKLIVFNCSSQLLPDLNPGSKPIENFINISKFSRMG